MEETYQGQIDNLHEELGGIREIVGTIKDNHLAHLSIDMALLKSDIGWIKGIGAFLILQSAIVLIKLFIK
ncbi:MAG: hypothetical protein WC052_05280 [Patescibacteria group bacterium]